MIDKKKHNQPPPQNHHKATTYDQSKTTRSTLPIKNTKKRIFFQAFLLVISSSINFLFLRSGPLRTKHFFPLSTFFHGLTFPTYFRVILLLFQTFLLFFDAADKVLPDVINRKKAINSSVSVPKFLAIRGTY